jgi:hypothetical protein
MVAVTVKMVVQAQVVMVMVKLLAVQQLNLLNQVNREITDLEIQEVLILHLILLIQVAEAAVQAQLADNQLVVTLVTVVLVKHTQLQTEQLQFSMQAAEAAEVVLKVLEQVAKVVVP